MNLYNLKNRYQTAPQIATLANSGTPEQAQALLDEVRSAILAETERHYAYTEQGGRGSPDGVAWEGFLKRALEERLGLPHSTLGMGTEGWYWS